MAQVLKRVRMLRTLDQFVEVRELLMGETYTLTADGADKLIQAGVAEAVESSARVEAAALAPPTRRG
jgi:hypothetical protein